MLAKIKVNLKNEVLLISLVLFAILMFVVSNLFASFGLQNQKAMVLFPSVLLMFCFFASQLWFSVGERLVKNGESNGVEKAKAILQETQKSSILNESYEQIKSADLAKKTESTNIKKLTIEEQEWLQELELTILNSLSDFDFTLERLSTKIHLSPRQIRRRIKQLTGKKYSDFLREIRMNTALQLLESGKVRLIKQVAYEMGMRDVKYFSQQFKAYFGKLPSAYLE